MTMQRSLGLRPDGSSNSGDRKQLIRYINLKLAALGAPTAGDVAQTEFLEIAKDLLADYQEMTRVLEGYLCPADRRIQGFLDQHLAGERLAGSWRLPPQTFALDRHGMARELSLPIEGDTFKSEYIESYRIRQGVLHNPKTDRRTTQGVYHVAEGGLPIPADKVAVPRKVFGNLLHAALHPPHELLRLPFTSNQEQQAELFCSLLLRPVVCPEVPGFTPRKTMEVRFFAPGGLVSNLDFVESIFGNAGDPYLAENDAGLDVEHWTGHTGCVVLAPHIQGLRKKSLGLPHWDHATDHQRSQGMCWRDENEPYNEGRAFKITCRTAEGVMVTLLADNYFGYSKKEIKSQISFSANLFGLAEEEHAGGALAFPSYSLGDQFKADSRVESGGQTFEDVIALRGDQIDVRPEGYAIDRKDPTIIYVPEDVVVDLPAQKVSWVKDGAAKSIKLLADNVYVHPTGYKVRLEKHPGAPSWRLIGTVPEGTFCHKPCTVSGGGKSEISKSISDAIVYGPIYTADFQKDMDWVDQILNYDYSKRHLPGFQHDYAKRPSRAILSGARTLGSVIKLLTPSPGEFTDEYNAWLESIPNHIRSLVFFIKRFYKPEWGDNWRQYFSVDEINGSPGNELKYANRKAVGSYLRVGFAREGSWRLYKLRQDFIAADKVQMEDDISASVVVPTTLLASPPHNFEKPCLKLVENCEYRLFQRPDDAIHRGMDKQTEWDMAQPGTFCSNFEAIDPAMARAMVEEIVDFDKFTAPMQQVLRATAADGGFVVSSANPRIVEGKPSKNPRYLQTRPDVARPRDRLLAEIGTRLFRKIGADQPVLYPVNAVLSGRRNNPADPAAGIRALAVYNPIHYQELPELFMDYVCSLTGKSPSTTGAGSEGALTKGPFNALSPAADLNNALVSMILTGYAGFSTAAGHVGPNVRVDHDISLLIPESWARLTPGQRDPVFLIANGYLEKVKDFDHNGRRVLASRLGYRITSSKFLHDFFGRVFDNPAKVFTEAILRPETQDLEAFADGVDNIVQAQQRVALSYFEDGAVDMLCPPLQALVRAMAGDPWPGLGPEDPDLRAMFNRDTVLESGWYRQRLLTRQQREIDLWQRHVDYLEEFAKRVSHADVSGRMGIPARLQRARQHLEEVRDDSYVQRLRGTIGADPLSKIPMVPIRPPALDPRGSARVGAG